MARFRGGQGRAIALAALLVLGFLLAPAEAADDLYYDRPVLTVDPGMHTGAHQGGVGRCGGAVCRDRVGRQDSAGLVSLRRETCSDDTSAGRAGRMSAKSTRSQ